MSNPTDPFVKKTFFGRPAATEVEPESTIPAPVAVKPAEPTVSQITKTVHISELDGHIMERMRLQSEAPEVTAAAILSETPGLHRLSLDNYFEGKSFDCTRGDSCSVHRKDPKGKVLNPGPYVMRWMSKNQRSLDHAYDVKGWRFVNRTGHFSDAPATLFSANGGVECGDTVLMYMSIEVARQLRKFPGQRSLERLRSQLTPTRKDPKRVMMTGQPDLPKYYEPAWGNEDKEDQPGGVSEPGVIQVD